MKIYRKNIISSLVVLVVLFTQVGIMTLPMQAQAATCPSNATYTPGTNPEDPGTYIDPSTNQPCEAPAPTAQNNASTNYTGNQDPLVCDHWTKYITNFASCLGRTMAVWVSSIAIWLTGWVLGIAGVLFNWLIEYTVVGFNTNIYTKVAGGVTAAWAAFRDLSNIVIIGIFIFVALEMILGTTTFGGKKTVAKILIIAVLINFSLLFTRIIIEASNFVSGQFYKAVNIQVAQQSAAVGGVTNPSGVIGSGGASLASNQSQFAAGVSGRFAQLMGIAGFSDSKDALWKIADGSNNGFIALLQGFLTAAVFIAAAAVFLYGAFLMIARSILLIFLLMTSSLAFASYLIPGGALGGYGWSTWWKSLLKSAVFGPLLIIFLWATLAVGEGLKAASGATIGGLLANPSSTQGIGALFSYLIILGMLFASIKIASSFATKIAGFNWAATLPALGFGMASRLAAFTGRQTIGRGGAWAGGKLQDQEKAAQAAGRITSAGLYGFASKRFQGLGKRDFNLMQTRFGDEFQTVAGFKKRDIFAGKAVGGFIKSQEKRAEAYAKEGARREYSDAEVAQMRKAAREAELASNPGLRSRMDSTNQVIDAGKKQMEQLVTQQKEMTEQFTAALKPLQAQLQSAQQTAAANPGDQAAQQRAQNAQAQIERENSRQKGDLNAQKQRISLAKEMTDRAVQAQQNILETIDKAATASGKIPAEFKRADALAGDIAHNRFSNLLARASGFSTAENDKLAKAARKEVGEQKKKKDVKGVADALRNISGDSTSSAPSGSTPPSSTP